MQVRRYSEINLKDDLYLRPCLYSATCTLFFRISKRKDDKEMCQDVLSSFLKEIITHLSR